MSGTLLFGVISLILAIVFFFLVVLRLRMIAEDSFLSEKAEGTISMFGMLGMVCLVSGAVLSVIGMIGS